MSSASFTPACLLYLTFCSIKSGTKHKTGERMKYPHEFNKDAVLSRPVISPALILVLSSFFVHTPQCSSYLLNTVSLRTTAHLITPSHHLSYLFSDIQPPISSNNTTNLYPSLFVISDTLQLLCSPSCPPSFLILPSSGDFSFSMTVLFSTWIMITVWLRYSPSGPRWQV